MKKIATVIVCLCVFLNLYATVSRDEFSVNVNGLDLSFGARISTILEILGNPDYKLFDNTNIIFTEFVYSLGKLFTLNFNDSLIFVFIV